jgi:hypothetical protein
VLELLIIGDLVVQSTQTRLEEGLRVESQHLGVEGVRESSIPLLGKLDVGRWQSPNELIVQVDPIIHAVVPNEWLFRINHGLDHQRESHLKLETFVHQTDSLKRIGITFFLLLFLVVCWLVTES